MEHGILPEQEMSKFILSSVLSTPGQGSKPSNTIGMIFNRDIKQFYKVFLQNQLFRNIQNALVELSRKPTGQEIVPISMHSLHGKSDVTKKLEF